MHKLKGLDLEFHQQNVLMVAYIFCIPLPQEVCSDPEQVVSMGCGIHSCAGWSTAERRGEMAPLPLASEELVLAVEEDLCSC